MRLCDVKCDSDIDSEGASWKDVLTSSMADFAAPCRDTTRYSLASRGVRVISGRSEDVEAADSNGAGKSALVMAPAWALTGRSDARAEVNSVLQAEV